MSFSCSFEKTAGPIGQGINKAFSGHGGLMSPWRSLMKRMHRGQTAASLKEGRSVARASTSGVDDSLRSVSSSGKSPFSGKRYSNYTHLGRIERKGVPKGGNHTFSHAHNQYGESSHQHNFNRTKGSWFNKTAYVGLLARTALSILPKAAKMPGASASVVKASKFAPPIRAALKVADNFGSPAQKAFSDGRKSVGVMG